MMTHKRTLLIALCGAVVALSALLLASLPGTNAQDEFGPKPTFVPAEALTPVPTPPDGRQVAILTLAVQGDGQALKEIRLERGQIISSYAPNVENRPGEWTVIVRGERGELSFGISDPRRLHVYGSQDIKEDQAHMTELVGGLTFELVVPLWNQDVDLGAREIHILDQNGTEIFVTEIDREGWSRQG